MLKTRVKKVGSNTRHTTRAHATQPEHVVCWAVWACLPGGACACVWSSCLVPPSLLVLPGARPRAVVCLLFLLLARSRPRGPWVIRFCVCCSLPPHVVLPGSDPEEGQVPETLVYHRPPFTSHARSQIYISISMPRLHANVVKVLFSILKSKVSQNFAHGAILNNFIISRAHRARPK